MDAKLIIMDAIILVNHDGNAPVIILMDDGLADVNDANAVNELIINAEFLDTSLIILE